MPELNAKNVEAVNTSHEILFRQGQEAYEPRWPRFMRLTFVLGTAIIELRSIAGRADVATLRCSPVPDPRLRALYRHSGANARPRSLALRAALGHRQDATSCIFGGTGPGLHHASLARRPGTGVAGIPAEGVREGGRQECRLAC